jgi:hypothetical protein
VSDLGRVFVAPRIRVEAVARPRFASRTQVKSA